MYQKFGLVCLLSSTALSEYNKLQDMFVETKNYNLKKFIQFLISEMMVYKFLAYIAVLVNSHYTLHITWAGNFLTLRCDFHFNSHNYASRTLQPVIFCNRNMIAGSSIKTIRV